MVTGVFLLFLNTNERFLGDGNVVSNIECIYMINNTINGFPYVVNYEYDVLCPHAFLCFHL